MIDEDLYQQATDELNSDKRRPHIWARACALASDDHDEARYLYTNLRVEELIAERSSAGFPADADESEPTGDLHDSTLALEPLNLDEEFPESISAPSGVVQNHQPDDELTLNSVEGKDDEVIETIERRSFQEKFEQSEAQDTSEDTDDIAFSDEYLDETINLTSELDGTAVFELDKSDASEFISHDFAEDDTSVLSDAEDDTSALSSSSQEDELESLLGGVYQASAPPPPSDPLADDNTGSTTTLDFSDVTGSLKDPDPILEDSLEWMEEELPVEENTSELQAYTPLDASEDPYDETGRYRQELERQADQLPGQRTDVVADHAGFGDDGSSAYAEDEVSFEPGNTFDKEAERASVNVRQQRPASDASKSLDDMDADASATVPAPAGDTASPERHAGSSRAADLPAAAAMAAAGVAAASQAASPMAREFPMDLTGQQTGTRYSVFRRGDQAQAVKNGVSWSALFLTMPYLVYRHLFGTAVVYGVLWIILLTGLLVSGLAWLDASTTASMVIKLSTTGFALLALIGLIYLPFRYANQWREEKLENRGFELVAWVRASSPGKAISAARRAAAFD